MIWRSLAAMLAAYLVSGCASSGVRHFRPLEHVEGLTEAGHEAAFYTLKGPGGDFGEAKLWSRGAVINRVGEGERSYLHVGFVINNTGKGEARLPKDEVVLSPVHLQGYSVSALRPQRASDLVVAPGTIGERDFFFELPPGARPRDLRGFRLLWAVHTADGPYRQRTPFAYRPRGYYSQSAYVLYDYRHPAYFRYRNWGYCWNPTCSWVYGPYGGMGVGYWGPHHHHGSRTRGRGYRGGSERRTVRPK